MREQRTKVQVKKHIENKTYKIIPTPCPPPTSCYKSTTPHLSHPPTVCNNNRMDIEFLVQMRQSDKCGSVRNDDIFNLTLGICCRPLSQHPLPPARHQPHLLIPSAQNNQPGKNKEPRNEIELPTNRIVLPWPTYTEPRAKRGRLGTQP